ncbi:unnamed protein product, partial [Durusdinium trenchii]
MPSCCGLWDLYHVLVNLWGRRHCEVQLLDAVCMGRDKWLGGELGQDGCVYGIPGSASRVLKITPSTREVELCGPEMTGKFKWLRGISLDGCIYGHEASKSPELRQARKLRRNKVVYIQKLRSCAVFRRVRCSSPCTIMRSNLPGVPTNSAQVLQITCATGQVDLIGEVFKGDWKWHGGVYCPQDQSIYGIPCNAECVLKISKGSVTTFAHDSPVLKGR